MDPKPPKVSIGLPVYNGMRYIEEVLDSILAQSFTDFELVILDNASTDKTPDICKRYAERDDRIRYYRNDTNLGAMQNFNNVFRLCRGEYFKWVAHDDIYKPTYLEKCVAALDKDPGVVLSHCRTTRIDEDGNIVGNYDVEIPVNSPNPADRFYYLIGTNHPCYLIFGLVRSEILRQTPLFGDYKATDRALLALLGLLGRFYEVPEYLFLNREHPDQSRQYCDRPEQYYNWWNTAKTRRVVFPGWRLMWAYLACIVKAPISFRDRVACLLAIAKRMRQKYQIGGIMARDITRACRHYLHLPNSKPQPGND
ncbi:MAG: glycosyltransferase family 2 protein [Candidatus Hydrogenedentes bacterium]|nr:glycosyltransferase family 2 protein [Candidatus Hydrogenedentota bacterium]